MTGKRGKGDDRLQMEFIMFAESGAGVQTLATPLTGSEKGAGSE